MNQNEKNDTTNSEFIKTEKTVLKIIHIVAGVILGALIPMLFLFVIILLYLIYTALVKNRGITILTKLILGIGIVIFLVLAGYAFVLY